MFKKHLVFMGLAVSWSLCTAPLASADDGSIVTPVSSSYRTRTPLDRLLSGFGSWSTRRTPVTMAAVQITSATESEPEAPLVSLPTEDESTPENAQASSGNGNDKPEPAMDETVIDDGEEDAAEVDIYAPKKGKRKRFKTKRHVGDTDVIVLASARPLDEGQINISLDELALWRAQLGVTDDFMLEANSLWGFSIGLNGKYALLRERNTAVSVQLGAGAFTVEKRMNWSYASLLYSKDMGRGAVHAGGYFIFAHTPDGKSYLVPQATAGAEVALMKRVMALAEIGFGNDILQTAGVENNTGFINLGLRLDLKPAYLTGGLIVPTHADFLDSPALGVPFLRIGATF